ncbi:unnamed protein product [Euphydryas editha]|uniref:Reverse transcriptase domain-containing protein n=1 Tax=Euphydryas editha TaxID=104508 RepID=A0AAU9VBJ8_EUPED|nr:unnamed protein product [Euphydryas editha]
MSSFLRNQDRYAIPDGVPQGSILGLYLFSLYINDIPKQPHMQLAIYADDTASYTTSILKRRSIPSKKIKINDHITPWSRQVKYLGTTLDDKVNWGKNIDSLILKGVKTIHPLRPILNRKTKISSSTKMKINLLNVGKTMLNIRCSCLV